MASTKTRNVVFSTRPKIEQEEIYRFYSGDKSQELRYIAISIPKSLPSLAYRKSLIHECVTGQRRVTEKDVARVVQGKAGIEGSA